MRIPWRLMQVAVVVAVFALLLLQLDLRAVRDALRDADPAYVVAAIALNAPVALLFWTRSRIVMEKLGHYIEPSLLAPIAILGNVAGAFTPASVGELLRGQALAGHASVSARDSFALVLFERGLSLYLMAIGAGVAAAFMWLPAWVAVTSAIAGIVLVGAPVFGAPILRSLARADADVEAPTLATRVRSVSGRLADVCEDALAVAAWTAQTLAIFALNTLQFWLLARGVAGGISYHDAWLAFSLPTLLGALSFIPLGLGAFDGSLAAVLSRLGMTLEEGTAVAVLVRAAISLPMLLLAFGCYVYLERRPRPTAGASTVPDVKHA